ncbi:MAG: glycine zipper domain-containing protein, partial [Planctomycetota bacterium]
AGASIGQLAGGDSEATLIGAAVGGAAGYMFGNESDKAREQAERVYTRQEMRTVAVNITNSNGSISQVRLKRHGVGYVGTRGEYYRQLPTEDQLRPIYGF